jgi:serine/threonine protein kinase
VLVIGSNFEVDSRYEIIDPVGSGAYGIVVSAKDTSSTDAESELVAIKKIERAFEHVIFTKRTLRELRIMRLLRHENILQIKNIQEPKNRHDFRDIYVITELMETDLASIIKSPQPLTDDHI